MDETLRALDDLVRSVRYIGSSTFAVELRVRCDPVEPARRRFLSGQYRRQGAQPEGRFQDGTHLRAPALLGSERAFEAVEALERLAAEKSYSLSQLAIGWTLGQPPITSPIIGPRTLEQLDDNLKALDVKLTPEDHAHIDRISPPGGVIVPYYQAAFGPTAHRWCRALASRLFREACRRRGASI
jgi:aryl-alcohol dehydrogenase-like predicted oxidoreductase